MFNKVGSSNTAHHKTLLMKKEIIPINEIKDRIKQTLTSSCVPTYDWMYELGLNSTQLLVFAYIFNVCKREPMKEHRIETSELTKLFGVTNGNISIVTNQLVKRGLISKRVASYGSRSQTFYSIFQPCMED